MNKKFEYYLVNTITAYRLLAAPAMMILVYYNLTAVFKWALAFSFFTDLIDGFLARKFKVVSEFGARLDSIADDMTILAAIIAACVFKTDFVKENLILIASMIVLLLFQYLLAIIRYKTLSSFHTYSAKIAAFAQGIFFILLFFLPQPVYSLFYITALITYYNLFEEIIMVILLPKWESDVPSVFRIFKRKIKATQRNQSF